MSDGLTFWVGLYRRKLRSDAELRLAGLWGYFLSFFCGFGGEAGLFDTNLRRVVHAAGAEVTQRGAAGRRKNLKCRVTLKGPGTFGLTSSYLLSGFGASMAAGVLICSAGVLSASVASAFSLARQFVQQV